MHSLPNNWSNLLAKLGLRKSRKGKKTARRAFHRTLRHEALERREMLSITVNTHIDELDGSITDGDVSLRDAIAVAPAGETIDFAASLNGATITLNPALGEIDIAEDLTIDASMLPNGITIDADDPTFGFHNNGDGIRIFDITDPTNGTDPPQVTMIGMTLTNADPAPGEAVPEGGAIRSEALLTLRNMTIRENGAGRGAGVYLAVAGGGSDRTILHVKDSVIEGNSAWVHGGGIFVQFSSATSGKDTVRIEGSSIANNIAGPVNSGNGGALYIAGGYGFNTGDEVIITSSHLDTNNADIGGAIYHRSNAGVDLSILQGSSVTGNTATSGSGGGIYSWASSGSQIRVENSSISGNKAESMNSNGGGLYALLSQSSSLVVDNSTISYNTTVRDGGGILARVSDEVSNPFPTPRAITISRSLISGNTAFSRAGGLYTLNEFGTETLIEESRITGNHVPVSSSYAAIGNGGGIYAYLRGDSIGPTNRPKFTITRSTVDNNETEQEGGGIFVCGKNFGTFIATNTTISGNRTLDESTGAGGGMFIARFPAGEDESIDAYLRNITVTQNTSATGGGVEMVNLDNVRVRIANSIISENFNHQSQANNLVGRLDIANTQYNLVGSGSMILDLNGNPASLDSTNITGVPADSPLLGALVDNGGPTPTHALMFGSPAIDQGSDFWATVPLTGSDPEDPSDDDSLGTDQRGTGFQRNYDFPGINNGMAGSVDIGAYELADLCVSTTVDEFNGLSIGDLSLREAVDYANTVGAPLTICLPAGVYNLTLSGIGGVSQGDLDITGLVSIVGDGPGFTIIDASALGDRHFDIAGGATLGLSQLTLAYGAAPTAGSERNGGAIRVNDGGELNLSFSAIVGNMSRRSGDGGGIYFAALGSGSIENSVITVNESEDNTGGVYLAPSSGTGGMVSVKNSIIAKNIDDGSSSPDVFAGTNRTFSSGGNNRLGNWANGFGVNGDMVGTPDYVVTTIADTYDGASDAVSMSLRDAIHRANITAGAEEIWLPAWEFVLTRDRDAYGGGSATDVDVSFGDLDIKDTLTILGTGPEGTTTVRWKPGIIDALFDLLGDYNGDGISSSDNGIVGTEDYTIWEDTEGSTMDLRADGNDDGIVNMDDFQIWDMYQGNTLTSDVTVV